MYNMVYWNYFIISTGYMHTTQRYIHITRVTFIYSNSFNVTISCHALTLSWRRPLSYRNQSIDLLCKSMDWFLYHNGLRHERVNIVSHEPRQNFSLYPVMSQWILALNYGFLFGLLSRRQVSLLRQLQLSSFH